MDIDIGANPSAEGGDEGEGVDSTARKVVDVQDAFRLQVRVSDPAAPSCCSCA